MKKIFKFLNALIAICFAAFALSTLNAADEPTPFSSVKDVDFPISGIHKKLDLSCKDCHKENSKEQYSSGMYESCLGCHGDAKKLGESTGHLGYANNIHNSPHWGNELACNVCHVSHNKVAQNLCLQCHEQDAMKRLTVK